MSFFISLNARLSTLGPLHLGSGEDYYPTGYVIKDGYLHAFNDSALLQALGSNGTQQLAKLAETGSEDSLREIQRHIHGKAEKLQALATHSVWVTPGIAAFYDSRVRQVAQREAGGRRVQNRLQIQRTFANPHNHQPIIPGSALKGAIRTAWLDHLNSGQHAESGEKNQELQKRLLGNKGITDDPFSLLKVSDAPYQHPEKLGASEVWFGISRKRRQLPDRSPQGVQNLLECIGPWRAHAFSFDIRFMEGGLRQTSTRAPSNPAELIKVCNAYYLPKLKEELATLGEREGYFSQNWQRPLQQLLTGELGHALTSGKAMLLRLGKHSGAEDKTLNGLRQIKILTKRDPATRRQGSENREHTTEVRLAARQSSELKDLLPFGWVLVEFDYELPQTHAFLRQQAEPTYQRQQQEAGWAEHRLAAQRQQEQKAAEQRQLEKEKAAAAEAEKQRLAARENLPPEQKKLEEFAEKLNKDTASIGKGLGSPLADDLRTLIKEAEGWSAEWRPQAREQVQKAFEHLKVDRKKNDKAKELWKRLAEPS